MTAVPGEEIVSPVRHGDGNVECVCRGNLRDGSRPDEAFRQCCRIFGGGSERKAIEGNAPCGCQLRIAAARLLQNKIGGKEIEAWTRLAPPLVRYLLMGCDEQITASAVSSQRGS